MFRLMRSPVVVLLVALAGAPLLAADGKVPRDGFDLHYTVVGAKGPYIVILAGGPGFDPGYMTPVAEQLGKTHRCILLAQRGTGRSKLTKYTPETVSYPAYFGDLEALREHLKEDKLTLVGHSWGMMLALAYAGAHPDRTRAVIGIGSGVTSAKHDRALHDNINARLTDAEEKALAEIGKKHADDPDRAAVEQIRILTRAWFADRALAKKFASEMSDGLVNTKVGELVMDGKFTDRFVGGKLDRITAPVLLVHGRQDPSPEGGAIEASRQIKNAKLELLDHCGHFPWLEQPERTWKVVDEFLAALDGMK